MPRPKARTCQWVFLGPQSTNVLSKVRAQKTNKQGRRSKHSACFLGTG